MLRSVPHTINTWIRSRDQRGNQTFDLENKELDRDAVIKYIVVVDHNNEGRFVIKNLNKDAAKAFITFFSAGIGNYDLKEDIFDFDNEADFSKRLYYLVKEQQLVNSLIDTHEILYLSADIEKTESRKCIEKFFFEGIML